MIAQESLPLWTPTSNDCQMAQFMKLLGKSTYQELHSFSVNQRSAFWKAVWEFCQVQHDPSSVLDVVVDEKASIESIPAWFPGAKLNYAQNILRKAKEQADKPAIWYSRESHANSPSAGLKSISFAELEALVKRCAHSLRSKCALKAGDVVAAYAPNVPEVVIYALAAASIGAIFTATSPDFGVSGVLERFQQTEPKVLLSCDKVFYNGKMHDHKEKLEQVVKGLSQSLRQVVVLASDDKGSESFFEFSFAFEEWNAWLGEKTVNGKNTNSAFQYEQLPFSHPLYIVYSSGTTGKPKCIVHGAGGTLLQHLKEHILHCDFGPQDVYFQYTTIGWMMWQWQLSALATGAAILLWDGSPLEPDVELLWQIMRDAKVSTFGTSARYLQALEEANFSLSFSMPSLRAILSTGSPLGHATFEYVYNNLLPLQPKNFLLLGSISGGTDILSLFLGLNPMLPLWAGEIQCACLGMDIHAWNLEADSEAEPGTSGELVCNKAFPSMPVKFWAPGGKADALAYQKAYFSTRKGMWFHGDWIQVNAKTGGFLMLGRSDGVLNPGGVRFGSSELYRVISEQFPEQIEDALAVGMKRKGQDLDEQVVLFLKAKQGFSPLKEELFALVKERIRRDLSPRHVPSIVMECPEIPYTLNGKKVEVAVKRIVCNLDVLHNESSMVNGHCLQWYRNLEL
jgi:acetoacetyl-CoA synthetase